MVTASAIAKEIGILTPGTEAVEGAVVEKMDEKELQDFVPKGLRLCPGVPGA